MMTIEAVCFDFDGTLVNSNKLKKDAICNLGAPYKDGRAFVKKIQNLPPPIDRFEIVRRLGTEFDLSQHTQRKLLLELSENLKTQIVACDFMPGALECLRKLRDNKIPTYLNSATPTENLVEIIAERKLNVYFAGIFGRPANKEENITAACENAKIRPENLLMIGDGVDDQNAAVKMRCKFQAVFDFQGGRSKNLNILQDLSELDKHWPDIRNWADPKKN